MKQKWKKIQFVEISMHEIFCFQDKLDAVKDNPEEVWKVVDDFFMECENQLELDPGFIKEMSKLDTEKDFVSLDIDEIYDELPDAKYDLNNIEVFDETNDDVRYKEDVPFSPRHSF